MSLMQRLRAKWREWLETFAPSSHHQMLKWLCAAYQDETQDAAQFMRHAERMYYPQFRERLLRIAEEERVHVAWLREQICALGGQPPAVPRTLKAGDNSWQNLLLDLDEEHQSCAALLQGMQLATHVDDNLKAGLQRIRQEEVRHHEEIRDMLMKSEPNAAPMPEPRDAAAAQQKQTWLEEKKMAWMAQQQAAWETAGKPIPWAEWEREQERRWTVELPRYELQWARRAAVRETDNGAASTSRT